MLFNLYLIVHVYEDNGEFSFKFDHTMYIDVSLDNLQRDTCVDNVVLGTFKNRDRISTQFESFKKGIVFILFYCLHALLTNVF